MSALVALRLVRGYRMWNAGEVAGFPPEEAEGLVAGGFAEPVEPPAPPEPEKPALPDFEGMTKAELAGLALSADIAVDADKQTKAEMIAAIQAALGGEGQP